MGTLLAWLLGANPWLQVYPIRWFQLSKKSIQQFLTKSQRQIWEVLTPLSHYNVQLRVSPNYTINRQRHLVRNHETIRHKKYEITQRARNALLFRRRTNRYWAAIVVLNLREVTLALALTPPELLMLMSLGYYEDDDDDDGRVPGSTQSLGSILALGSFPVSSWATPRLKRLLVRLLMRV